MHSSLSNRIIITIFIILCLILPFAIASSIPGSFPTGKIVTISSGQGLSGIAQDFKQQGLIRSAFIFKMILYISGGSRSIKAGDYSFDHPLSALDLSRRLIDGEQGLSYIKVTFPEGTDNADIPGIVGTKLPLFNTTQFLSLAKDKQGYLFPDTYLFLQDESTKDLVGVMEDNFTKRIATIQDQITAFGKPLSQVVNMAAILEKEGRTTETRRTIAGILWKRIQLGMPLEVDSTLEYVTGKNTFQLSLDDLNNSSLYNTYRHAGLPPGPITNPGLDSLLAAVTPIKTPYLFFLTDNDGVMHYATTFAEHVKNKQLYLK